MPLDVSFQSCLLKTPLGSLFALADNQLLQALKFIKNDEFDITMERYSRHFKVVIKKNETSALLERVQKELEEYFMGTLKQFTIPLSLRGSPFQQNAWKALQQIPYGSTRSYLEQAAAIGRPTAYRAVANANGANMLSIIIPCHRIINQDGKLGGYTGGIDKKIWLLAHEEKYK